MGRRSLFWRMVHLYYLGRAVNKGSGYPGEFALLLRKPSGPLVVSGLSSKLGPRSLWS